MNNLPETLEPATFDGGMPRCRTTKRPAFATAGDMERYFGSFPRVTITHKWRCTACNHWHCLGFVHDQFNRYNFAEKQTAKRNESAHAVYVSNGFVSK